MLNTSTETPKFYAESFKKDQATQMARAWAAPGKQSSQAQKLIGSAYLKEIKGMSAVDELKAAGAFLADAEKQRGITGSVKTANSRPIPKPTGETPPSSNGKDTVKESPKAKPKPEPESKKLPGLKPSKVTFLRNVNYPKTFNSLTLEKALATIKNNTYKTVITELRALPKDQYKVEKLKLPSYCFNGTFTDSVTNDNFAESSGLFHFDIDGLDPETLEQTKQQIAEIPSTVFVFVSPSGKGLKGAVRIDPDWVKNDDDYKLIYPQVSAWFSRMGITLDENCKDVRRPCFVSHDPELYVNYNAELFPFDPDAREPEPRAIAKDRAKREAPRSIKQTGNTTTATTAIDRATDIMLKAESGDRHDARLRAGMLGGGYVAGGWIEEAEMKAALMATSDEISDKGKTTKKEQKALDDGFEKGLLEPIALDDNDVVFDKSIINAMLEKMKTDKTAWAAIEVLDQLLLAQAQDPQYYLTTTKKLFDDFEVGKGELKDALKPRAAESKKRERERRAQNSGKGKGRSTTQYRVHAEDFVSHGEDFDAGVYFTKILNDVSTLTRICGPLFVEKNTCTHDGKQHGRFLRFITTQGAEVTWSMPSSMVTKTGSERLVSGLLDAGLWVNPKASDELGAYIMSVEPSETVTAVTSMGWTSDLQSFLMHDRVIGAQDAHFQSRSIHGISEKRRTATGGEFSKWQDMTSLFERNPLFGFAVCVNLAGPLVGFLRRGSGGFHFYDESSSGKSTLLRAGASVWGGEKFMRLWRGTDNGMEATCVLVSGTCLGLDEAHQADKKIIQPVIYMIANGDEKLRAVDTGGVRETLSWDLLVLSSGEYPIATMGEKKATAGQEIRMLDISVDREFGTLDSLEGFDNPFAFIKHIQEVSAANYGFAGPMLVEELLRLGDAKVMKMYEAILLKFNATTGGQAARVAERFGMVALAGEIAITAGILPWKKGTALKCCLVLFKAEIEKRCGVSIEKTSQLECITDYIDRSGDADFVSITRVEGADRDAFNFLDARSYESSGYKIKANVCEDFLNCKLPHLAPDTTIYLFYCAALDKIIGDYDLKTVVKLLESEGWLVTKDKQRHTKQKKIKGSTKNFYVISPKNK